MDTLLDLGDVMVETKAKTVPHSPDHTSLSRSV
jgi:hypothetical protein